MAEKVVFPPQCCLLAGGPWPADGHGGLYQQTTKIPFRHGWCLPHFVSVSHSGSDAKTVTRQNMQHYIPLRRACPHTSKLSALCPSVVLCVRNVDNDQCRTHFGWALVCLLTLCPICPLFQVVLVGPKVSHGEGLPWTSVPFCSDWCYHGETGPHQVRIAGISVWGKHM